MLDIHCHILPDFDDGSSSIEESVEMARMAFLSGVTDIAATPHFEGRPGFIEHTDTIARRFDELTQALSQAQIPIRLHRGAEVLCLPETPLLATQHQLPTLGQGNYVLVEFFFDESYAYMDQMLSEIASCGYRLVVAHPERYGAIQRDPHLLKRWARQGFALQLNKGSVLGAFGGRAQQAAEEILSLGLAHLFATDAHSCHSRTPHVGALMDWAGECCDEDYAQILLQRNPRRILSGRPLVGED